MAKFESKIKPQFLITSKLERSFCESHLIQESSEVVMTVGIDCAEERIGKIKILQNNSTLIIDIGMVQ